MNLETIVIFICGLLVGIDLAVLRRQNKKLREQLLELATLRSESRSAHKITIECDNSQALASLAEVQLAAERAAEALKNVSAVVH